MSVLYNMGMRDGAIGVFDSGVGGLSVVKEIKKILPEEKIIYLGDTARVPYGSRSREMVIKFSCECAEFLRSQKIKVMVVACNTASANAVEEIKSQEKVKVFEVITPGAKQAVELSKNGKIGVLATRATVNSGAYGNKIRELRPDFEVREVAAPLLVPLSEEGVVEGRIAEEVVAMYLKGFENFKFDTLVLGCTHYPILQKTIKKVLNDGQTLVNSGEGLAKELKDYLIQEKIQTKKNNDGDKYYFTDVSGNTKMVAERFLGKDLEGKIEKVNIG